MKNEGPGQASVVVPPSNTHIEVYMMFGWLHPAAVQRGSAKPHLKWVGWVYRQVKYRAGDVRRFTHTLKRHFLWKV